jgi:hypothetical protein
MFRGTFVPFTKTPVKGDSTKKARPVGAGNTHETLTEVAH